MALSREGPKRGRGGRLMQFGVVAWDNTALGFIAIRANKPRIHQKKRGHRSLKYFKSGLSGL